MKTTHQKLIRKQIAEACIERQCVRVEDFNNGIINILNHEGLVTKMGTASHS